MSRGNPMMIAGDANVQGSALSKNLATLAPAPVRSAMIDRGSANDRSWLGGGVGVGGVGGGLETSSLLGAPSEDADESEDAEDRLARSRERNREHARRTRLRKKAHLRALQDQVGELQAEGRLLRQTVEECSIASILLGLSASSSSSVSPQGSNDDGNNNDKDAASACALVPPGEGDGFDPMNFNPTPGGKRKRFLLSAAVANNGCDPSGTGSSSHQPPMKLKINGRVTVIGGDGSGSGRGAHINWKTGVYCDEDRVQRQLSPDELEALRRERNRMHAKMTRDRKKNYIANVERTIADLERDNRRMRETLACQARRHFAGDAEAGTEAALSSPSPSVSAATTAAAADAAAAVVITPGSTPMLTAAVPPVVAAASLAVPEDTPHAANAAVATTRTPLSTATKSSPASPDDGSPRPQVRVRVWPPSLAAAMFPNALTTTPMLPPPPPLASHLFPELSIERSLNLAMEASREAVTAADMGKSSSSSQIIHGFSIMA